ncbi:MAG: hypothetical protein ACE5KJ_02475, partial [Candidatus Zixiibacteriota bacterium]
MRKRYKFPLAFISFLLLAGLIFWVILTQTRLLENQVNRLLGVFVEARYPIKVKVGDISGSFWKNLVIKDISVDFTQEGQEYRMASITYLKVNYKLSNLWRKKWILDSLRIDRPKLTIKTTKEGQLLIPLPKRKGMISKTGLFDFKIGNLKIEKGSLRCLSHQSQIDLDSLNFELSLSKDKQGTIMEISQGNFICPQKELLMKKLEGLFSIKGDSISIRDLRIQTDESKLEISGDVTNIEDPQFSFSLRAESINLEEIKKMSGVGLEGRLKVEGTGVGNFKKFEGKATLDGLFFERRFNRVKLTYIYEEQKLIFPLLAGKVFGSSLKGKGKLDFGKSPEEYEFDGEISNLNLNNVIFNSFHTDLTGDVSIKGKALSEKDLILKMEVNLGSGRFDEYTFTAVKGSLTVATSAVTF